jgi:hypothetical protein
VQLCSLLQESENHRLVQHVGFLRGQREQGPAPPPSRPVRAAGPA